MVRIWVASLHQKNQRRNYAGFCFARHLKSHSRGWIRTAAATSLKMAQKQPGGLFLAARLATSTRAHQELQYPNRVLEFLFYLPYKRNARVDSNSNSDDRCQRQKQGGAVGAAASRMRVPPKARCSRWEPRPGLLFCAARAIHPRPPKNLSVCKYAEVFVFPGLSLSRKKHLHFRHAVL